LERVKVGKGSVEVSINPAFYSKECVLRTKKVFSDFAKISVKTFGSEIVVLMKPKSKAKLGEVGYEFYNHLLNTAKEMRLGL
jgi:hypothetical protein